MSLFSHPGKPLIEHLEMVANLCQTNVSSLALFPEDKDLKPVLTTLAYLAGAFHDIGKGTRYFQHYLLHPAHEVIGPKNHALISALFVKEMAREYLETTTLSDFDKELYGCMVFTAVKRHHGKLLNFEDELYVDLKGNTNSRELKQQITAFDEPETERLISFFTKGLALKYRFADFKKYIQSEAFLEDMPAFYDEQFVDEKIFQQFPAEKEIAYYYCHQLLFGSLLLSDKSDVIVGERNSDTKATIPPDAVQQYKTGKGYDAPAPGSINAAKNEAFDAALQHLEKVFSPGQHIYSLTLPTGLGKTMTSFAVAQQFRELLGPACQRIIVCIPFTSIIDQNFDVYREIVGTDNTNILLKHHHLAEPAYKTEEGETEPDKSQFLIETWQSEVVITTFVQLLNSLFSNDKALLMKLPNLANSVVVLDEVQTIHYQYWQLIKNTFETLGKAYNCYFILMSATQPLLFIPEKEIIEIVPDYRKFFSYFNRTKLINKTETAISLATFADEVTFYLQENPVKDVLIILNTKKHSKELFERLRNEIDADNDVIYYLSTLITPYERKRIIQRIKDKSGQRKIIVSTQLVEAGVDISVDTVFRALAPVDSIIQAAGRANRYGEKARQGEVYLYEIEELKNSTAKIYGADLITKTKNVLRNILVIDESGYLPLIENYYQEVRKQSDNYHCTYLEAMQELRFEDVGKFSLIEEVNAESVFLQLNEDAKVVWDTYEAIYKNPITDIFQKREAFATIKSRFYDYVINVPVPWGKSRIDFEGDNKSNYNFYLSPLENPSRFYSYDEHDFSQNTGYQSVETLTF